MDILMLQRKGLTRRTIARKLGISRNTVKKYIENPELFEGRAGKRERKSQLDPYLGQAVDVVDGLIVVHFFCGFTRQFPRRSRGGPGSG